MIPKYLDVYTVIINQVSCNISIVSAFYGANYKSPLSENGKRKWDKPQTIISVVNILLLLLLYFIIELSVQGLDRIGAVWNIFKTQIIVPAMICMIITLLLSCLVIGKRKDIYTGKELDKKYIEFTDEVGTGKKVYIIAGDFNFFGRLPKSVSDFETCKTALRTVAQGTQDKCNSVSAEAEKCRNCVLNMPQFKQILAKKRKKAIKLKILCRKPQPDENDYRIAIGYLATLYDESIFRFYSEDGGKCPDLPLRGRIIVTANGIKKMFSHFVKESKRYQALSWNDSETAEGKTYIGLYSILWEFAEEDADLVKKCKLEYEKEYT